MRNVTTPRGPTSVWLPQCVMSGLDYKKWNLPGGNVECHTGNGTWAKLSTLSSAARSAHFHLLCDIHRTHPVEGPLPVLMKALSPLILTTPPNATCLLRVKKFVLLHFGEQSRREVCGGEPNSNFARRGLTIALWIKFCKVRWGEKTRSMIIACL